MNTILPPGELFARIDKMPKEQVKALYDAALDVSKGSRNPMLPDTAKLIVQQIAVRYPTLAS